MNNDLSLHSFEGLPLEASKDVNKNQIVSHNNSPTLSPMMYEKPAEKKIDRKSRSKDEERKSTRRSEYHHKLEE